MRITLGSSSPRRREILSILGLDFVVQETPFFDNPNTEAGTPQEVVERIAAQKMEALQETGVSGVLLTADTIVVVNSTILGKPRNETDAIQMLRKLSGTHHFVYSAVCLKNDTKSMLWSEKATVYFRELEDTEILSYVQKCQPFDKAGGYGIQDKAAAFVTKMEGEYYTVLGLPVVSLVHNLKEFGIETF